MIRRSQLAAFFAIATALANGPNIDVEARGQTVLDVDIEVAQAITTSPTR